MTINSLRQKSTHRVGLCVLALLCVGSVRPPGASAQDSDVCSTWELISAAPDGTPANDSSRNAGISADGRFVYFSSVATNLMPDDPPPVEPPFETLYVFDREARMMERYHGEAVDISADGRFVLFESPYGPDDPRDHVYVLDRTTGVVEQVDVASDGTAGNWGAEPYPFTDAFDAHRMSADGRFVVFSSDADNLVPGDTNRTGDVFVRDHWLDTTERVSIASDGSQGNNISYLGSVSLDGRFVFFNSGASNLVPGDTNRARDVFVRDRWLGTTERVTVRSDGTEAELGGLALNISADGRYVWFGSASDLAPPLEDTPCSYDQSRYLRDRWMGTTERIRLPTWNGFCWYAFDVTPDVRFVAGWSPSYVEGYALVHDRATGGVRRMATGRSYVGYDLSADGRFVVGTEWWPEQGGKEVGALVVVFENCLAQECSLAVVPPWEGKQWGHGDLLSVFWTGTVPTGADVTVELYRRSEHVRRIADPMPNVGFVHWTIPADIPYGRDYWVSIEAVDDTCMSVSPVHFTIGPPLPPCTIETTYPNGGEEWRPGQIVPIRWTSGEPNEPVDVELYKGGALIRTLGAALPNTGSFTWTIPADLPVASDYTVRLRYARDPSCWDGSDEPFSIVERPGCALQVVRPNGGERWVRRERVWVYWSGTVPMDRVDVVLFRGRNRVQALGRVLPNTGSFTWLVPPDFPVGTNYRIKVIGTLDGLCRDVSDGPFSIVGAPCSLTLTYPNGGEVVQWGDTGEITWTGEVPGDVVNLYLFRGRTLVRVLATDYLSIDGRLSVTVPPGIAPGSNYRIKIRSSVDRTCRDVSDAPFAVVRGPCSLEVRSPNGGEALRRGEATTITWSGEAPGDEVHVLLFRGRRRVAVLGRNVPNTGSLDWVVPAGIRLSSRYRILIRSAYDRTCRDRSDATFSIVDSP